MEIKIERYSLDIADKLIELWSPRIIGHTRTIDTQVVTFTEFVKNEVFGEYEILVMTDSPYLSHLNPLIFGDLSLLSLYDSDIKQGLWEHGVTSQEEL